MNIVDEPNSRLGCRSKKKKRSHVSTGLSKQTAAEEQEGHGLTDTLDGVTLESATKRVGWVRLSLLLVVLKKSICLSQRGQGTDIPTTSMQIQAARISQRHFVDDTRKIFEWFGCIEKGETKDRQVDVEDRGSKRAERLDA
jgi:hypothetical protein